MRIAILTSPNQWFCNYAIELSKKLGNVKVYNNHLDILDKYDVLFILAYHKVIGQKILSNNLYNLVVHESNLPLGKGWSPLFWQILEGKNQIVVTLLEASKNVDSGLIYLQKTLYLTGYELNSEIRQKQAEITFDLCLQFVSKVKLAITPKIQNGKDSFYSKRSAEDSRLDPSKSLREQFNLLRICDNEEYPAFFEIDNHRYLIKIEEDNN